MPDSSFFLLVLIISDLLIGLVGPQEVAPRVAQQRRAVRGERRPVVPGRALVWAHIDSDLRREALRLEIGCEDTRSAVGRRVQLCRDRGAKPLHVERWEIGADPRPEV